MNNEVKAYLTMCLSTYRGQMGEKSAVSLVKHPISLAELPPMEFSWMMTPEIAPGQLVIVAQDFERRALYTIDWRNRPFQIAGTRDLLLGANEYQDLTLQYQSVLRDVQSILRQVFMELSLQEMNYCTYLSEWEWNLKETVIANNMAFEDILSLSERTLLDLPNKNLSSRLCSVLQKIKKPRKTPLGASVDWGDYNLKLQTKLPATD